MNPILLVIYTIVCLLIVVFVLVNQSKSAGAGAAFGGASQTVFGSRGSLGFITKTIIGLAVLFFIIAMALSLFSRDLASEINQELEPAVNAIIQQNQELPELTPEVGGAAGGSSEIQLPDLGGENNNN